jgi:hypothetical protein
VVLSKTKTFLSDPKLFNGSVHQKHKHFLSRSYRDLSIHTHTHTHITHSSKSIETVTIYFCLHCIIVRLSALTWGYFHPYRVNRWDYSTFCTWSLKWGGQKYWDKFTYMCIEIVKSLVYIKFVNIQTCWMHLLFVLVVFKWFCAQ